MRKLAELLPAMTRHCALGWALLACGQQGELDLARRSLDEAADFLDEHPSMDPALQSLRREAESLIATLNPSKDLP
jgi:hypothetical protein